MLDEVVWWSMSGWLLVVSEDDKYCAMVDPIFIFSGSHKNTTDLDTDLVGGIST